MYLLIAGIYLHDIGMQCDVTKFPVIKVKAIKLGAIFKLEFTSTNANQYSLPEQIEIRNNHHFLSAAWIDYAFNAPETTLGKSIQSVPNDLLLDLVDICKYHSKLNISECPLPFEIHPKGRKQLIATLVRFSDELDVDKSRVSIETVMNFSFEPENAYYWWLHHLTHIDITDNILVLKVSLHPTDYLIHGSFVKETYIENFGRKNKPVLDILKNNQIPISISADSDVKSYEYALKLPDEIVTVIQGMQNKEVVIRTINILDTKQLPNNQLRYYPKPKPYFAGRETELKDLKLAFEKSPFIFIEGGGGIGKTQFVAKFIEDQKVNEKVVWYECIPTSLPDDVIKGSGFEELLKGKEKTEREKFSAFKDKIEAYDLVVFLDNYQEVESIPAFKSFLDFINDYLRKGHLIVLGRDNIVTPQLQPRRIPIKGLGEDSLLHAQKLIEQSYPDLISTPTEELKKLCHTLKGYPLAVDLAIYLLSLKVTIDNILNVAVIEAQTEGSEIEKISNRLLNEIFTRPDASEDEREFLKLFSIFRGKIQLDEAQSVIPLAIFDIASRKLINRNLLEFNDGYLELHPLIREFCYDELVNKKEIHHKAAQYYIENRSDKWNPELEEKIFYHLSCSEQWIDISDTIIKSGKEFILHGFLDRLQQMITLVKTQNIFDPKFYIYEGDIAEIKGNWDTALALFEKTKQSSNEEVRIEGIIKYGEMLYRKGDVKEAQTFFDDAIVITKGIAYGKWNARALNDLGLVNMAFGNLKEAITLYNVALQIRLGLFEQEDISNSFINIGKTKDEFGLKIEALELYEMSLNICKKTFNKTGIANSFNSMAGIKADLGFKNEALQLYGNSLKIFEEVGNISGTSAVLNNIGSIKSDAGFKKEAIDLYERSLTIAREVGDKLGIATCLLNIGKAKAELGLKREALKYYERSLKIGNEIGSKSSIANSLNNIGGLKDELGLKKVAFEYYEQSLKIREEIGAKSGIANSLNNIGGFLYLNNGDIDRAILYLLRSFGLFKQMGVPEYRHPLDFLLTMRKKLGKIEFKELVLKAYKQLDEKLQTMINLDEIFGDPIKVKKIPGRNELCYCGSGKKFKYCHGK